MEPGAMYDVVLSDPRLQQYAPSERRAILVHKYLLGTRLGFDPGLGRAIEDWEEHHARDWRERKMRSDVEEQLREIERHKYHLSEEAGYDVGWEFAIHDWMQKHADSWREHWEQHSASGA